MPNELTVEELIEVLRCCASRLCSACPASGANCVGGLDRMRQTADALESLAAENKGLRENNESRKQTEEAALKQLAAALAENTRLAKELDAERHR